MSDNQKDFLESPNKGKILRFLQPQSKRKNVTYLDKFSVFEVEEFGEGRLKLRVKADVTLVFDNLELITQKGHICLDTLDGCVHLNSRAGTTLKGLPESKLYLEKAKKAAQPKSQPEMGCCQDYLINDLKTRIIRLENDIKNLETLI